MTLTKTESTYFYGDTKIKVESETGFGDDELYYVVFPDKRVGTYMGHPNETQLKAIASDLGYGDYQIREVPKLFNQNEIHFIRLASCDRKLLCVDSQNLEALGMGLEDQFSMKPTYRLKSSVHSYLPAYLYGKDIEIFKDLYRKSTGENLIISSTEGFIDDSKRK